MSLFKYKNFLIDLEENNGNALLELYTFGQALGHTRWNGTKTCQNPRIGVIDSLVKRASVKPYIFNNQKYITIESAEKLIAISKSQEKIEFKKWFTKNKARLLDKRLASLVKRSRTHFKYSTALRRRKVLLSTNIGEVAKEIVLIMENLNEKDLMEREKIIKHMKKIILERR